MDWRQFDGANLTNKIRSYVDAPVTAVSAMHRIDGHEYCLVCLQSLDDGLPVPFSKLGQFVDENGKTTVVFRPGDITGRDGAQNRSIEYLQWSDILARHDAKIREDEAKRINSLIDEITVSLGAKGKTPPLVFGMDDSALAIALEACLEQGEETKIVRFINQLNFDIERSDKAIDGLAAVATSAISYGFDDVAWKAVDALYDHYLAMDHFGAGAADKLLDIVVATYEIGASMVLASRWDMISPLVNRQSPHNDNYVYASWIRHCQVSAVRAGKFKDDTSTMMISIALDNIKQHAPIIPEYCFDVEDDSSQAGRLTDKEERVLELLCSFDFLYCLCVFVAGDGHAGAYPACVGYEQKRINSVTVKMFGRDERARRALLPDCSDAEIANGLRELLYLMNNEALNKSRYAWAFDPACLIGPFLEANPPSEQS